MARYRAGDRVMYKGRNSRYGKLGEKGTVDQVNLKTRDSNLGGDNYNITTDSGRATEWYDHEVMDPPAEPKSNVSEAKPKKRFGLF